MGQPACKIAEANSEAQATPPENLLQSETAIDASSLGQRGEALKVFPAGARTGSMPTGSMT